MWWERWIPKLYLTKSNICGVECIYSETGISFNYAVLNIKKNKVEVSVQGTTTDAKEILTLAKKLSAVVSLAIVGKGVITKKIIFKSNPRVIEIQDDLEKLLEFCQDYGYRYNEADLYNFKSYAWQQYNKYSQGKNAKNMWDEDTRRLAGRF